MKLTTSSQPNGLPEDKPFIVSPVKATLGVPVYYVTERGPVPTSNSILCGRNFAITVLMVLENVCQKYGFAVAHVGIYNPRKARHKDGTPILPARWSNHAYAEAIDWKGIITEHGNGMFLDINAMQTGCPAKLKEILDGVEAAIVALGRRPEIVDEGSWYHLGLFPVKK